jgi:hypothetical protein
MVRGATCREQDMINIAELKPDKDVGRWVQYKDFRGTENGRIKSWNDEFIFVVYHCDNQWHRFRDFTGAATNPEELTFISAT